MRKFLIFANKIADICGKVCFYVAILLLVAIVLSVGLSVFVRVFLDGGFIWTDEFARWCLVAAGFIGGAEVLHRHDLISLDFIINRFHGRAYAGIQLGVQFLCLAFLVVFVKEGFAAIPTYFTYKALTMPTNQAWPMIAMVFAGIMMLVFIVVEIFNQIYALKGGNLDELLGREPQPAKIAEGGQA